MIQSGFHPFMMKTFCPYPAGRDTHHNIKSTPYGSENPVWWVKTRLVQGQIPSGNRTLCNNATQKANGRADDNTNKNIS